MRTDEILRPKPPNERMGVRQMEGGFELRLFFSGADLVGRGAPADQEGDGINEERLAGSGLPVRTVKPD